MNSEIDVRKQFSAALNRNDMHGIPTYFDPQIVRIEPEGFPTAGTYRGIADVQAHMSKGCATWAEGTCEPEQFLTNGDKVVVYLHVRVRLKDSTDWVGGRFADGFVFRDGKITHYRSFGERLDARKCAGVEEHDIMDATANGKTPADAAYQVDSGTLRAGDQVKDSL